MPEQEPLNQNETELVDNGRAESRGETRNIYVYGGNYNERIQGNYHQNSSNSEQPGNQNTPCNIKKTGSANFVGREKKLEELHQLLQSNEKVTVSAIAGMGGIGKSELALQYALAYQKEKENSKGRRDQTKIREAETDSQSIIEAKTSRYDGSIGSGSSI